MSGIPCPCCGSPVLSARHDFEICDVCGWEDDGQDNADAEVVRGGPNGLLSLAEARRRYGAGELVKTSPVRRLPLPK